MHMKKLRVGISIAFGNEKNIWNSGIHQNIAFLAQLLQASPLVERVWFLNAGPDDAPPPALGFDALGFNAPGIAAARCEALTHELDLVIECGVTLPIEWLRHVRALGAKIVTLYVGHVYAGQAEGPIFGRNTGTAFVGTPWHEVWTLPHHMKTSGPMLRTVSRVPVHAVPHIWSPMFLEHALVQLGPDAEGFGFRPPGPGVPWRVAIVEPNISVVKNCTIPMLACEHAYRQDRESLELMMVVNSFHMKEHPTFNAIARHLDLTRDGRASFEPRVVFPALMAQQRIHAVVAHQWECGLNYAYYDALHGGYPLVHNSEFLQADGQGFYYPGFEARAGGDALLRAWRQDASAWAAYRSDARAYLARLHPLHERNVRTYTERIAALMEASA